MMSEHVIVLDVFFVYSVGKLVSGYTKLFGILVSFQVILIVDLIFSFLIFFFFLGHECSA